MAREKGIALGKGVLKEGKIEKGVEGGGRGGRERRRKRCGG